jgi:transporter family-2 protein
VCGDIEEGGSVLTALIGIALGMGLPVQTSINARLRRSTGSPFVASLVSFTVGAACLGVVTLASRFPPGPAAGVLSDQPAWIWAGGALGVVFLTGNLLLLPVLGAVQTVVIPVFGQIAMGMLIDANGWFDGRVVPLGVPRSVGALLVAAGVVGAVVLTPRASPLPARGGDDGRGPRGGPAATWSARGLGLVSGMLSACQTAINAHLGQVLGSPVAAAFTSFAVGSLVLAVIVAVARTPLRLSRPEGTANPWWMWIGGLLGGAFVLGNVYLAGQVGTGLAVLLTLTGSIIGSLLVDRFGWFGTAATRTRRVQVAAVLIMLAGAALTRLG